MALLLLEPRACLLVEQLRPASLVALLWTHVLAGQCMVLERRRH